MKSLSDVIRLKDRIRSQINHECEEHERRMYILSKREERVKYYEDLFSADLDVKKVRVAEDILFVKGDILARPDRNKSIVERGINVLVHNPGKLMREVIANKNYEGFHQACDVPYGYGPKHGSLVDELGFKRKYRDKGLSGISREEIDACIYYLLNYKRVREAEERAKSDV